MKLIKLSKSSVDFSKPSPYSASSFFKASKSVVLASKSSRSLVKSSLGLSSLNSELINSLNESGSVGSILSKPLNVGVTSSTLGVKSTGSTNLISSSLTGSNLKSLSVKGVSSFSTLRWLSNS